MCVRQINWEKMKGPKDVQQDPDEGVELSVHRVSPPPKAALLDDVKLHVKETFFPDDPLRHFRDVSHVHKIRMFIEGVFPILVWSRNYSLRKFRGDLIAGLTIASLCIPQDIGYAKLAKLDAQYGLYSSFVPPLVYAAMGSSMDIAIGPVAVVSILLGTLVSKEFDPTTHKEQYQRLMFTATFFAGLFQFALGLFRLGFIIDFLSHAAIVGFMAGAAITIGLQQLKGLFGIANFTKKTDIVSVMRCVFADVHGWNWQTIVIGVSFMILLIATKVLSKKKRKLFWVAAVAPLFSVILSTLIVYLARLDKHGVLTVNHINKGLNRRSANELDFKGSLVTKGVKIGAISCLIALTEGIAIGRTFAALKDYHLDGNKEMVAMGVMNVAGSLTSCYVTTGSFSRSAVNYNAGCRTLVSNIVMSIVVMLTLLFITPLFKYTPNAIIASIIIAAVLSLIDIQAAWLIWKIDKMDFLACIGAFFGVVFSSVEIGLLTAVIISVLKILLQVTRPHTAILGRIPGTNIYRNVEQYPDAQEVSGVLVVRVDSALYFTNANYIRERILRWVEDKEKESVKTHANLKFVIIAMSPITNIDTSGIHAFDDLHSALAKRGVQLALANPTTVVLQKLHSSKLFEEIGAEWVFLTVGEAVQTCSRRSLDERKHEV